MQPTTRRAAYLVIGVAAGLSATFLYRYWTTIPVANIDVYDGFEGSGLSRIWSTDRFEAGAVSMQSEIVHAGHGAVKIVVHSRDKFEAGVNGNKDTERAELKETDKLMSLEGRAYEYSFSMFLPADFPIVPTRLVIAQWKQDCQGHGPCSDDSPVVALRYVAGEFQITQQTSRYRMVPFETNEELRGHWNDFRLQIRFSPYANGLLRAWMNGVMVVDTRGATAYPENPTTGYDSPGRFYFKMGLYRDVMEQPMTIYIDEYRKRELATSSAGNLP